ncbi:hypothetical protein AX14_011438 [Amanita brunnescens Koide BX004]|nr:hypothetical protein AX14_011438 [Amanita brunnescens Koide BX004]
MSTTVTNITVKDVIIFRSQESTIVLKPGDTQELRPAIYNVAATSIFPPTGPPGPGGDNVEGEHGGLEVEVPSSLNPASLSNCSQTGPDVKKAGGVEVTNVGRKSLTFAPGPLQEIELAVTLTPGESGVLEPIHYLVRTENWQSAAQQLLSRNADWAKAFEEANPGFFARSAAEKQKPHTLWIGCSDSRVPPSVVTSSRPGDIFVHRNIANQLPLEDNNALSVLEYAVRHLGVQHVIIVGHSECGGVLASVKAVQSKDYPTYGYTQTIHEYPPTHPLNRWLAPLTKFVESLGIASVPIEKALPIAVEANIIRQVGNLSETAAIRNAWKEKKDVSIHGWIYELATGRLRPLEVNPRLNEGN